MTGRVVVVGSLNVDLVARVERHPHPGETVLASGSAERFAGGKGGNQAMAAALAGASVQLVGAVGADEPGAAYQARLAAQGVDVALVQTVPGEATGQAWITVDGAGENAIVVVPGANGAVTTPELQGLGSGDVVLLQLEIPLGVVAAVARQAADRGCRVVLNAAPFAALPPDVAALADPLVVNEHEALLLADSGVVPGSLLVTFGAAGCTWDGVRYDGTPVAPADVVDTTGAGDAFCGALAAALAAGAGRAAAVARAATAGAEAVRRRGAQPDPVLAPL
ncbi:PfkB family carbohydrate kinase [Pedococcus sp. 5OH_020]|uniref:PfkB family carbohydrate kinase n=1 Tax=Pedococcus sp. 5OH_020 TaxID=2989814 RepID=UPI0022EA0642|nr:PfkB family carbohydrate kinase [Pedococcus sp. 5OH_020]